jgi:hypothetical protein
MYTDYLFAANCIGFNKVSEILMFSPKDRIATSNFIFLRNILDKDKLDTSLHEGYQKEFKYNF